MKIESSNFYKWMVIFLMILTAVACKDQGTGDPTVITDDGMIHPGPEAQAEIQEAFNDARSGDVIKLAEGTFDLTATLTMNEKTGVTLEGRGRNKTILSFAGQESGSNGLLITNSNQIVVRDLTILDAVGDALKFQGSDGIVMYRVAAVWSGEPSEENGSYGLYPVQSSNILIDECYAYGASDAGIYVGQSDKAIVRNSKAEGNVAGIEIENTTNADVYNNTIIDNTGGILVFDLPWLSQAGSNVRVFNNTVGNNGRRNFAPAGTIVSQVPAGTGILVMSNDDIEIFGNEIDHNNVIGTGVFSVNSMIALEVLPGTMSMSNNPHNIHIHSNSYSRSNTYVEAEHQSFIGNLLVGSFGKYPIPDVILDGFFSPEAGESGSICLGNNAGSSFVNLNIPDDFPNKLSFDPTPHNCSQAPLSEVVLAIPPYLNN
jgi:parallel beta-helix repeat protein